MSNTTLAYDFLKQHGFITHKDIQKLTDCNCCYSVMRNLKKLLDFKGIELKEEVRKNPKTKKYYNFYYIEVA